MTKEDKNLGIGRDSMTKTTTGDYSIPLGRDTGKTAKIHLHCILDMLNGKKVVLLTSTYSDRDNAYYSICDILNYLYLIKDCICVYQPYEKSISAFNGSIRFSRKDHTLKLHLFDKVYYD